jgi:outer membrane protein TolC
MNRLLKTCRARTTTACAALVCAAVLAVPASVASAVESAEQTLGEAPGGEPLRLTLEEALGLAIENSDELAMARAGADAAKARVGQARAGFFPSLSATGSYTRLDEAPYLDASGFGELFAPLMEPFLYLVEQGYLDPSTLEGLEDGGGGDKIPMGDDELYAIGLSVRQPLFTGGALLSAHGAARHGARAGELNARRSEDRLRYDVTRAYVGLVQARSALAVTEDMETQMRRHLADAEAMYEQGMLLESDLLAARVRMSQIELERRRAEHLVGLAGSGLAFVVGLDVETEIEPAEELVGGAIAPGELDVLTRAALESRPDLMAARELAGAADNAVSFARSDYFPKLMLIGSYNWDRPNRQYEPDFYDHWSVTLAAEMNVFDWGLTRNRVREARAGLVQAERGTEMMEEAVRLEVRRSYLELDEAADAAAIAEEGLAQARESMRVVREGFRNGTAKNSDVLAAQTALATAEMNRVAALARLRTAEAGLALATGGSSSAWSGGSAEPGGATR